MASYEGGYDDERFPSPVSRNLLCGICLIVLRKPMQCVRNEHFFCNACITRYLQETQRSCPCCKEALTLQTLRPSRVMKAFVSELITKCDNSARGCADCIRLENLEAHVARCGFSPVQCSNEDCDVIINRKDQVDHETNECKFRLARCRVCGKNVNYWKRKFHCYVTRREIDEMKRDLKETKDEMNRKMSKERSEVTRLVGDMQKQISDLKNKLQRSVNIKEDIVIAGGDGVSGFTSVEKFCWSTGQWTFLSAMMSERYFSSSFVQEDQMFVCGGFSNDTIEILELKKEGGKWKELQTKLPQKICGHASTVYEENLFIFGGESGGSIKVANDIYKIGLVSPSSSQLVSHLPEARSWHDVQRFGDKVAIVGGTNTTTGHYSGSVDKVLLYDITRNCCRTLAPLPFAVSRMATVAWRDKIIIIGGLDKKGDVLNTVISYNITSEKSKMLPLMKHKRSECTAVRTRNVIVVMGGRNEEGRNLNSVESFSFDNYSWEELPAMNEARWGATAIVESV